MILLVGRLAVEDNDVVSMLSIFASLSLSLSLQVMMTHYVLDSLYPQWEKGVEFFVTDFTQVCLNNLY